MSQNLAARSRDERDRINVDLAASGVAYKERLNQPVILQEIEMQQPEALRVYYREGLQYYRILCRLIPGLKIDESLPVIRPIAQVRDVI